ncbi:MAG TPA: class F sortase [Dehalococcoidia bacterium]|nr:class F sortase [Dehalococcoidia bacterium]
MPEVSPAVPVYLPREIEIPDINVKAPVVQVGLTPDGAMEAPNGPDIIGWYNGSVAPGVRGNALVTAHVDWLDRQTGQSRTAVFWDLHKLEKGDTVIVHAEENKSFTYTIRETFTVRFDDPEALKYLEPKDDPILTLITCEGDFDANTRNYDKRRIVVADMQ